MGYHWRALEDQWQRAVAARLDSLAHMGPTRRTLVNQGRVLSHVEFDGRRPEVPSLAHSARGAPGWLSGSPGPTFAFLHEPADATRSPVVVICPPFGWEEMAAHRSLRACAGILAGRGSVVLRMNLPGGGDSGGGPEDPDLVRSWTEAVARALEGLAEAYPGRRLATFGIGLGGLVVCEAVARGAAVDDLVLWGVPSRGQALVRQLQLRSKVVAARYPSDAGRSGALPEGAIEAIGYLVSAETAAAVKSIRLPELELPARPDRRALLLSRDRLAVDDSLRRWLEGCGAQVTVADGPGYDAMTADPQHSLVPLQTVERIATWLSRPHGQPSRAGDSGSSPVEFAAGADHVEVPVDGRVVHETAAYVETGGEAAFTIASAPVATRQEPVTAVFLNAGALGHAGPNRMWVELARTWAARGVPSVRVDLDGIGDAEGDRSQYLSDRGFYLHAPARVDELLAVLDDLECRGLPPRFVLVGLCSGAFWALHAALRDERVVGAYLLNLYSFFWSRQLADEREPGATVSKIRSQGVGRILRGDVTPRVVGESLHRMARNPLRRPSGRSAERAQRPMIEEALGRLHERSTDLRLLLGEGEPLYAQLERDGFLERLDQWPNVALDRIPSADHMLRALWVQRHVKAALDEALGSTLRRLTQPDALTP